MTTTKAARIRVGLDHPVIDADGHFVELAPVLDDALLASLEDRGWLAAARPVPGQPGDTLRHLDGAGRTDRRRRPR